MTNREYMESLSDKDLGMLFDIHPWEEFALKECCSRSKMYCTTRFEEGISKWLSQPLSSNIWKNIYR